MNLKSLTSASGCRRALGRTPAHGPLRIVAAWAIALVLSGCASTTAEPPATSRPEVVLAVTEAGELIRVRAGQPSRILDRVSLQGLRTGERLVGLDVRVARGVLFALSSAGRLYTVETATGRLQPVGQGPAVGLKGSRFGFDFNPVADRIRVVSDAGQNLRLHPDTGVLAAADPDLGYDAGDARAGQGPRVAGAAYTYHPTDDKLTTNYAIDLDSGSLVMQGSKEGRTPVVSPNTGRLVTVGPLGAGPLDDASLDISDRRNTALAALRSGGHTRLHLVDLETGRASLLGTLGDGGPIVGLAIEP